MKYIAAIVSVFVLAFSLFSNPVPVYAQSCGDTNACDESFNCTDGNCVACTKTVYYPCDSQYPFGEQCSCQAQSTCCDNGWCTVCTTDGQCYTNGCPPIDGDDDDDGPPPPGSTNTPVPPTVTPTPIAPATLRAVAKRTTPDDTSCAAINASTTGVDGNVFGFTVNPPAPQTQSGVTPVEWTNVTPGTYTMTSTPPDVNYAVTYPCLYRNGTLIGYGWSANANGGDTIDWEVGYTYGTSWVQTQGGDVYAASTLRSYIPAVTPRVFNGDSDAGYPGVVTYGTTFDFDSSPTSQGGSLISSTNWQVNTTRSRVNYYDFFYRRYGSPATPTTDPAFDNPLAVTKPLSSTTPYYVVGDMTTSGNWSVGSGESIVILVDGNLTLGGRVNVTGDGFISSQTRTPPYPSRSSPIVSPRVPAHSPPH